MYRQGLTSITPPPHIYTQILSQIHAYCTIESDTISTQTVIFSTVRPIGYLYKQIEGRTVLRLALKQMIYQSIDQLTGEVKYYLILETGYRFGSPPVYIMTDKAEITATRYQEYIALTPYESFERREIVFIDKATQKRYTLTYTQDGGIITFNQYSKSKDEVFELPEYLKTIIYAEGDKWEKEFTVVQAKWREKQEAAIAARKAEIQAKKDAEKARKLEERKAKAAAKKVAEKAKKKANKSTNKPINAKKSPKKSSKVSDSNNAVSESKKRKKEETAADMWAEWRKRK